MLLRVALCWTVSFRKISVCVWQISNLYTVALFSVPFSVSHGCGSKTQTDNSQISLIVLGTTPSCFGALLFGSIAMICGWNIPHHPIIRIIPIIQSPFLLAKTPVADGESRHWRFHEQLRARRAGRKTWGGQRDPDTEQKTESLKNREVLRCVWHLLRLVHVVRVCVCCFPWCFLQGCSSTLQRKSTFLYLFVSLSFTNFIS